MDILIGAVVVLGAPTALGAISYWSFARDRHKGIKRRGGGELFGIVDEVFRPQTHQAQQIQKIQHELPAPAPSPGDPPRTP